MPKTGVTPSTANLVASGDPLLRKGQIQGDVLIGLQKDEEIFLFFTITNVRTFRRLLKDKIVDRITSTEEALSREIQVRAHKEEGHRGRLPFVGLNLSFTAKGVDEVLGPGTASPMDHAFAQGAAARAGILLDPIAANGKPDYLQPFADDVIHGVFLVTGPRDGEPGTTLADAAADDVARLLRRAITIVHREKGVLRPQRGHEHFGFLDGVSNPGVRGLTPRRNPADRNQGLPGQDLLWPGEFVFGYSGQDPNRPFEQEGPPPPLAHPWMRDGSLMVFRRLNQKVQEFHDFVNHQGAVHGMDPSLLGARMVGRWPSGAPVMIAPLQDDPLLGDNALANNDFEFSSDTAGRRCPFGSHIRKTYPRDDLEDPPGLGLPDPEGFVQAHRIMRAGIPFGPELDDKPAAERGLMFVCYQTSIADQFEFIQSSWCNSASFPPQKTHPDGSPATPGEDPIIGRSAGARQMDEIVPNYPTGNTRSTLHLPTDFVVPTAAAYFFTPSIDALRHTFGR